MFHASSSSLFPLFSLAPPAAEAAQQQESSLPSPLDDLLQPKTEVPLPPPSPFYLPSPPPTPISPWGVPDDPFRSSSVPLPDRSDPPFSPPPSTQDPLSTLSWSQSQWVAFSDDLMPLRRGVVPPPPSSRQPLPPQLLRRPQSVPPGQSGLYRFAPPSATLVQSAVLRRESATCRSEDSPAAMDVSAVAALANLCNDGNHGDMGSAWRGMSLA